MVALMIEEKKPPELEEAKEEDQGTNMDDPKGHYVFPLKGFIIFTSIIIALIIVCVVVILCNGGFYQW